MMPNQQRKRDMSKPTSVPITEAQLDAFKRRVDQIVKEADVHAAVQCKVERLCKTMDSAWPAEPERVRFRLEFTLFATAVLIACGVIGFVIGIIVAINTMK